METSIRRILSLAGVLALASFLLMPDEVLSQNAPALTPNPNIKIDYIEPPDPVRLDYDPAALSSGARADLADLTRKYRTFMEVRERLMKSRLLERLSMFLSPLKLPTTLRLVTRSCGYANATYSRTDTSITLCYEYVQQFERNAPKQTTEHGITREDAIVGGIVSTMLHETGHALFSIYRLPVLGKEEDAADQLAGYVMLQFGRDVALATTRGAAWEWLNHDWTSPSYHDSHATAQQRFYNTICIGYGAFPEAFQKFVDMGKLPKERAASCAREYQQIKLAFETTVGPHLDMELATKVLAASWLQPGELGPTYPDQ